jgi:hypothetical protein
VDADALGERRLGHALLFAQGGESLAEGHGVEIDDLCRQRNSSSVGA